jgi:hypothetical protein
MPDTAKISTRLAGHYLYAEGKPFYADGRRITTYGAQVGHGMCSCGSVSDAVFDTDAARKRWHRDHKDKIRAGAVR